MCSPRVSILLLLSLVSLATLSSVVVVVEGFTSGRTPSGGAGAVSQGGHHHGSGGDSSSGHDDNDNSEDYADHGTLRGHRHRDDSYELNDNNDIDGMERVFEENMRRNVGPNLAMAGSPQEVGLQNLEQLKQELEGNIIKIAENIAEESTKKCHALRERIDYNGLKTDLIKCLTTSIELVVNKVEEIVSVVQEADVMAELGLIQHTLAAKEPLSAKQKDFLKKTITRPVCSTLKPLMTECENHVKYEHLKQFEKCKSDVEKDAEQYVTVFLEDVCRNDAQWMFDFWDAKPVECVDSFVNATKSPNWEKCKEEFKPYQLDRQNPEKQIKRVETHEEFCDLSGTLSTCLSDVLVNSCPKNRRPGQVLLDAFKETRNMWSAKCDASSSLIGSGASMLIIALLALIRNFCNFF